MSANTIDEVIGRLEAIVHEAREEGSPFGIFALVYLGVTQLVRDGIRQGRFQDGQRMERLDVLFANRYLLAYEAYRAGQPCTESWATAFGLSRRHDMLVLQHLFTGMNAHISLDLGVAAARAVPANSLPGLEPDFLAINALLSEQIDRMQDRLARVSPLLFLLDWFGKKSDEHFAAFSLVSARGMAWKLAQRLSPLDEEGLLRELQEVDAVVAEVNRLIAFPGRWAARLIRLVKWFETKDMKLVLARLAA